ncbi:uncharacterized protein LOC116769937 isoform X1 [Danaus plexippus]|uniref:uncharacterized protein LOC116769937 isoform X1 n=1 Tax=Danaus plexippus TaxID=13037 RepID=UPI002AAF1F27|nr:uncharacterized protein LOC116769937 isoform X1 [Danaus plexippus]
MNLDGQGITDEFIITAERIFEFCEAEISSTLCVNTLMEKFAPFVKTNKDEYSYLRSLLDPDDCNPDITVTELAATLSKYSDNQKVKADLEESFNLKTGLLPHDSDSGISSDGFQLLEELQCELREKAQVTQQLRRQLDDCDALHEEALAAAASEAHALREHLNMLREENSALTHVRHDYEEVCEQLTNSERALTEARGQLESAKRRTRVLTDQVAMLETEKLSLQELLAKSKRDCHHINEMYAARHKALLEQNENLRSERAELAARAGDLDRDLQQLLREKVILEMELKDMLNKSNTHLRMERSIDISYTEDQMLTALDSLNADSKFTQESIRIDEESFLNEDHGRPTNLSLFDEMRLSFCNLSRYAFKDFNNSQNIDRHSETGSTNVPAETQTEVINVDCCCKKHSSTNINSATQTGNESFDFYYDRKDAISYELVSASTQTTFNDTDYKNLNTGNKATNTSSQVFEVFRDIEVMNKGVQTNDEFESYNNNNNVQNCIECTKCMECDRLRKYTNRLEIEVKKSDVTVEEIKRDVGLYEDNLDLLRRFVDEGNERNVLLKSAVDSLRARLFDLENKCTENDRKIEEYCDVCSAEAQADCDYASVSTQTELLHSECVRRQPHRSLRRYLCDSMKWLFQVFAVVCFACAVWLLCGVTRRPRGCHSTPWWWMHAHELLDFFLTIEYVSEVPM